MGKTVRTALIPAAGRGTRLAPWSRHLPKELLPLGGKPVIHLMVEEAVASGITEVAIITRQEKPLIAQYFTRLLPDEPRFTEEEADLQDLLSQVRLHFITQEIPRGLGDALTVGREFTAGEPFAVLLPDNLFGPAPDGSRRPVMADMLDAWKGTGGTMLACRVAPVELESHGPRGNEAPFAYVPHHGRVVQFTAIREKGAPRFPAPETPLGEIRGVGRGIFDPAYLDAVEDLRGQVDGELDDIRPLRLFHERGGNVFGYLINRRQYDVGDMPGYGEAQLDWMDLVVGPPSPPSTPAGSNRA